MKYYELMEAETFKNTEEVARNIFRDCQPFLKMWGWQKPLFRGSRDYDTRIPYIKEKTRQDRKPLDTRKPVHDAFVQEFNKLGFKANRNNSIFCTGDKFEANHFGTVYTIFPVGQFDFTWSSEIRDLTRRLPYLTEIIGGMSWSKFSELPPSDQKEKIDTNVIRNEIRNNYKNGGNINAAIFTGNEIMLTCKEYYLVNIKFHNNIMEELYKIVNSGR